MAAGERTSDRVDRKGQGAKHDPALVLSQAWVEAHARTLTLCLKQQQLETELAVSVGFPSANVGLPDDMAGDVSVPEEVGAVFNTSTALEIRKVEASEALTDHLMRWRAKDAELGYSAAKEAEQQAVGREQRLLDGLVITPAHTIAGVIAKLAVVLRDIEENREASDFPLPQIRSALKGLTRITNHDAPHIPAPSSATGAPDEQQSAPR